MQSETAGSGVATHATTPWGVKAMILAGGPAVGLALGGVAIVLPKIAEDLAHTPQDQFLVKMLGGIVGAAMLFGAPLTGYLADRIGLRRVLFLTYALFTISGAAGMVVTNLWVFLVSRFFLGVAGAAAVTASIIIVNKRLAPDERAKWMGFYIAASYVATFLLHPLAGFLADLNWHYAFSVYLFGAPFALIALMSFQDAPQAVHDDRRAAIDAELPFLRWFPFGLAGLGLFMGLITYLGVNYVPFQLAKMGVQPGMMSILLLAGSVTGMVTSLMFGRARRVLSDDAAFALAFLTCAVGGIVAGLAANYMFVVVGYAIYGLGTGWFMPNLMYVLGRRVTGQYQGRTAGFVKACNYVGMPLSILLFESSAQEHGYWLPIMAWGLISTVLTLVYAIRVLGTKRGEEPAGAMS